MFRVHAKGNPDTGPALAHGCRGSLSVVIAQGVMLLGNAVQHQQITQVEFIDVR